MRRADIILANSRLLQQQSEQERKCKRPKQSSSPKAANSSPKTDTVMLSPIKDSVHSQAEANLMEKSGLSSCDVSAILSPTEMDDINKSFEGDLEDFVQALTNVKTTESLPVAAAEISSVASRNIPTETSSLSEPTTASKKAPNGKADRDSWFRNRNKLQRLQGEAYCSSVKNEQGEFPEKAPRLMGPRCDSKRCERVRSCRLLSDEDRQRIFSTFWSSMDWDQRKIYVVGLVDIVDVKRKRSDSRRQQSVKYHLKKGDAKLQVCKNMFLSTLCLGEWTVQSWLKKADDGMIPAKGRSMPQMSRSTENLRENVRKFLNDMPKLPSHYCRASSTKLYLEPHFRSLADVYKLFKEQHTESVASRQVFADEFGRMNLALFMPKKDQCDKCCAFKTGNVSDADYQEHVKRKDEARQSKENDKKRAEDGECHTITMDVQAVQLVPQLQASALYFRQKLAVHNFTLYNMSTNEVVCYVWHEGEGELNGNIFASCVVDYLVNEVGCTKDIVLYSDGCANQNRNVTLSNALTMLAKEKGIAITHNYLEKGHTQMECDSVHSVIERKKKNRDIFVPAQYVQLIQDARTKSPYKVRYIDHTFFKDFTTIREYSSIRPGRKAGDPTVVDLRCLKYVPSGEIHWKLRYTDDWNQQLPSRRNPQKSTNLDQLKPLYDSPLNITSDKFKDLQFLKQVMLPDYHAFYDNLTH